MNNTLADFTKFTLSAHQHISKMNYAILDIETTGGSPNNEKITEIAIYIHNGKQIINKYASLINPEKNIPYFITGLTGISNEMVADSPKFFEIAKDIVEITKDCIVVGHNVNFDYSFIQSEFKHLGYDFQRNKLCTIKLSRKLIPGYKSYSLGKICKELNISINGRHRAAGDAFATVKLFELLLKENEIQGSDLISKEKPVARLTNLNGFLKPKDIDQLPSKTGVYYLHDEEGNLIYVGKSKNIHNRILTHLGNRNSRRATEMAGKIAGISFELTGNELIALLLESVEIKSNKPIYNRAQRRSASTWGLYEFHDDKGYLNFRILKTSSQNNFPVASFNNQPEAKKIIANQVEKNWLCPKLSGLYSTEGSCFHYEIRQCNGACIGKEASKSYNERAQKLINKFEFEEKNLIIIDKGRSDNEKSVVLLENGLYIGYGYINTEESYLKIEDLKDCIKEQDDNRDIRQIINLYLRKNKPEKIIRF